MVDPVDPAFADDADFDMEFVDPEPAMALEPVVASDPVFEHDPVHAGVPIIDPVIADPPIDDHPVDAPLLEGDHIDPRDEHAQHGWIPPIPPHTTDVHHIDTSFSFPQFTPPARPGEGSSAHPFGHVPTPIPVVPQFSPAIPPVPPFSVPPFDPAS
ncbi:lysine-rich arabinogalactan protein 19-like [Helianthus annuus]|uniref:lysine-rich arabinogalactan protein 19-like n=1 Tax=Helianthus annuus TaxID=4232 RepID=UPI000B903657|nr:lysine-rich arabinogalactan protein 19-like [Helianthus annuus]